MSTSGLNWLIFHSPRASQPCYIEVSNTQRAQDCRALFHDALCVRFDITALTHDSIGLYKPKKALSLNDVCEDGWAANVNFNSTFDPVPPGRPLVDSLKGLDDPYRVHLIVIAGIPPIQANEKFDLWYRYLDMPDREPHCVALEKTAFSPQLRAAITGQGLADPRNPNKRLTGTEFEIWELQTPFNEILASDSEGWKSALKKCGGDIEKMAVKFLQDRINTLSPRRTSPIQAEGEDELRSLTTLYPRRFERLIAYHQSPNAKTPSSAAASATFRNIQQDGFAIYDGRQPAGPGKNSSTIAMPPSLYHPVFEHWKRLAFDQSVAVPRKVIAATSVLMRRASVLYSSDDAFKSAVRPALQDALLSAVHTIDNDDLTILDGQISVRVARGEVVRDLPVLIEEEEREGAEATVDATTQASFSMIRAWSDPSLDRFRNLACCPTFLIGFSGCHIVVSAAVLTDKCIVQRLAMMWVGHSSTHDDNHMEGIARALYALSCAFNDLQKWYEAVIAAGRPLYVPRTSTSHPRFFPHACQYPVEGENFPGATVNFQYLCPLQKESTCVTFLAQTTPDGGGGGREGPERIVVKFVQRYCADLHRLLADNNLAPALRYCGKIDGSTAYPARWKMVVMDYAPGRPSYKDDMHKQRHVRRAVLSAVKVAHDQGFVCGDVRPPNVLVQGLDDIKLIDFDWGGKEGEVYYPVRMTHGLWARGMEPLGLIEQAHDYAMVDKWFPGAEQ
ncbi:hypothetical protein D9619_002180 [Psilocybe cf. subviscida]|uniref:Protein kinase domain-containing protein n=1 Tax=Psilocybe cf. subviscida TaxID=2480587 RepID=A0A8H5BG32_9AGAR|nr:hypothetical protein D9619_002180 [Psilocybe cf. subviscida]